VKSSHKEVAAHKDNNEMCHKLEERPPTLALKNGREERQEGGKKAG